MRRQHAPDVAPVGAARLEGKLQPFGQKRAQFGDRLGADRLRVAVRRRGYERRQRRPNRPADERLGVQQQPENPVCGTPEAEWIARSGRPLPGQEQTDERVELVGERNRRP
jgi:hypothetical protein